MVNFDPITGDELPGTYSGLEVQPVKVPAIPQSETVSQRILRLGYSSASPEDKAAFDAAFPRSQAAKTMSLDQARKLVDSNVQGNNSLTSDIPSSAETIAPNNYAAQMADAPITSRIWAGTKDALTLPLRVAAGAGAGIGTTSGGGSLEDALTSFQRTMAHPSQSVAEDEAAGNIPDWSRYTFNPEIAAYGAEDPKTIPMLMLPGGAIRQGLAGSMMTVGQHAMDRAAQGKGIIQSILPANTGEAIGDVLPSVFGLGANGVGSVIRGVSSNWGPRLQEKASDLIVSLVKPSQSVHNSEAKGLEQGLSSQYQGKDILPSMVDYTTASVPQMAKNYKERLLNPVLSRFAPTIDNLADEGVKISTAKAIESARSHMAGEIAGGNGIDPAGEGASAIDWLQGKMQVSDNPKEVLDQLLGNKPKLPLVKNSAMVPSPMGPVERVWYTPELEIGPAAAHYRKAAFLKGAFEDPTKATARVEAAEGGGLGLRNQLIAGGINPTPGALVAGRQYGNLMKESAPVLAMEDAMARAEGRENRHPLSLPKIIALSAGNVPGLLFGGGASFLQEHPGTARAMWDIGKATKYPQVIAKQAMKAAPLGKLVTPYTSSASAAMEQARQ